MQWWIQTFDYGGSLLCLGAMAGFFPWICHCVYAPSSAATLQLQGTALSALHHLCNMLCH